MTPCVISIYIHHLCAFVNLRLVIHNVLMVIQLFVGKNCRPSQSDLFRSIGERLRIGVGRGGKQEGTPLADTMKLH